MPLTSMNRALDLGFKSEPPNSWDLAQDGADWAYTSRRYGNVRSRVVTDETGKPLFSRPQYNEADHVITVLWYKPIWGEVQIGLVLEARPHAEHPDREGDQKFWGVPRGFRKQGESPEEAARREAGEEAGVGVVQSTHFAGLLNPNPTFVGTFGPVVFLRVNSRRLNKARPGRNEKIFKAKFFPRSGVASMVVAGIHEDGLLADGVSLAAICMFLCWDGI